MILRIIINTIRCRWSYFDDCWAPSPELFSSIVALFITHSALGLGTVVGSEIFNQLTICAGATFASKTGIPVLDKTMLIREVEFYALAIILLHFALQGGRPSEDNPDNCHLYTSFYQATMVFIGYILCMIVCSNVETILSCFTMAKKSTHNPVSFMKQTSYGANVSSNVSVIEGMFQINDWPIVCRRYENCT